MGEREDCSGASGREREREKTVAALAAERERERERGRERERELFHRATPCLSLVSLVLLSNDDKRKTSR